MNQREEFVKTFVTVMLEHRSDGTKTPKEIRFDDGRRFEIDRVTDRRRAASTKVGGTGIRYTIFIHGQERRLFEDDNHWFVEGISDRLRRSS